VSLAWLCVEGTVGVIAGIVAGSIALVGFGLDSAIEGIASVIVVWRFTGARTLSNTAEGRAQKLVAASFFLLAPYIAVEATHALISGAEAETSWLGIGLSVGALFICQPLGLAKRRIGNKLGSSATSGEGTQNLLCGYLAGAVLVGLLGNAWFGLWWLDPIAALAIGAVAVVEGRKAWRGESCECAGCAAPIGKQSELDPASNRSPSLG
jgi:divalent metal cation (Fe/Co/Zn/Cd) transporter